MRLSGADAGHLAVAFALTYVLGFERELRAASAGDRVFSLIGLGSGLLGIIAVHTAATALTGAITGIGFIGGGLVFRQVAGGEQVVKGITTAAARLAAARVAPAVTAITAVTAARPERLCSRAPFRCGLPAWPRVPALPGASAA